MKNKLYMNNKINTNNIINFIENNCLFNGKHIKLNNVQKRFISFVSNNKKVSNLKYRGKI